MSILTTRSGGQMSATPIDEKTVEIALYATLPGGKQNESISTGRRGDRFGKLTSAEPRRFAYMPIEASVEVERRTARDRAAGKAR